MEEARVKRKAGLDKFSRLLRELYDIRYDTRWKEAVEIFSSSPQFKRDPDLTSMDALDLIIAFEDHIKSLERDQSAIKQSELAEHRKKERLNRCAAIV